MDWHLSTGRLPTRADARYVHGQLVELTLLLQADGLPWSLAGQELQHGFDEAYSQSYSHDQDGRNWFKGFTEIEL